ncbi:hypothetical protein VOI54_02580 [Tamlana sp. 2201CG12-4]|uniref:hypothetical protein n=1 Tax=Tamlana sp. 2201CG12-4 TaxID=3112582 RepID=UPI002DBD4D9F|nr:hypothetical protein [Tamlana sp. 2201CG12-4]MEC3905896.1 hypothetical protein [Tamlana sp. 2201CG12-4]
MSKKLVIVCLINFLIAALMGVLLRYSFVGQSFFNYRFLTHAHSHIAMLGWVYLILYVLIVHYFVPEKKPIYNKLFWVTQFAVVGMMLSFPFQGYAAISISFSTLHIFCSYYFVYLIWKQHKAQSVATQYLLKASLIFMLLSTGGVWCLGPAVSMLGRMSAFYNIAIQFFLHFQFNGWFLIAVLAIFFHLLGIQYSKQFQIFFKLLMVSTVLTMALPIYWFAPYKILLVINGVGVCLQLLVLFLFLKLIKPYQFRLLQSNNKLTVYLYNFVIFCLILKLGLQLVSLNPEFSETLYQHRNLIIGFIHLTMLGIVTGFLFSFILQSRLVIYNMVLKFGIASFVSGFILTELLLMIQGIMFYLGKGLMSNYYLFLFLSSILLPLGIAMLILNIYRKSKIST